MFTLPSLQFLIAKQQVLKHQSRKLEKSLYHTTKPLEPDSQDSGGATSSPIVASERNFSSPSFAVADVSNSCVVDTGCQRTAVGANVLAQIVDAFPSGMHVL